MAYSIESQNRRNDLARTKNREPLEDYLFEENLTSVRHHYVSGFQIKLALSSAFASSRTLEIIIRNRLVQVNCR